MRASGTTIPSHRRAAATLSATVLSAAVLSAATATSAHALGPGSVCMFNAPSGASGWGHVGWGFRDSDGLHWWFGATEFGDGKPSSSWSQYGSWSDMLNKFTAGGGSGQGYGYYTQYRCDNTGDSSIGAATREVGVDAANGYNALTNNCLTKTIDIYKAYSSHYGGYYNGDFEGPNNYFDNLPSDWSGTIRL